MNMSTVLLLRLPVKARTAVLPPAGQRTARPWLIGSGHSAEQAEEWIAQLPAWTATDRQVLDDFACGAGTHITNPGMAAPLEPGQAPRSPLIVSEPPKRLNRGPTVKPQSRIATSGLWRAVSRHQAGRLSGDRVQGRQQSGPTCGPQRQPWRRVRPLLAGDGTKRHGRWLHHRFLGRRPRRWAGQPRAGVSARPESCC